MAGASVSPLLLGGAKCGQVLGHDLYMAGASGILLHFYRIGEAEALVIIVVM